MIIKFRLTISIREFRLNDLSENHLIIIKFINFDLFNNKDVNEDSIWTSRGAYRIFIIFYKFEFHIRMLIRIDEKKINFDDF